MTDAQAPTPALAVLLQAQREEDDMIVAALRRRTVDLNAALVAAQAQAAALTTERDEALARVRVLEEAVPRDVVEGDTPDAWGGDEKGTDDEPPH